MAEETEITKESKKVEYTPEELEVIQSLLSYFIKAPGQIDIPDTESSDEPGDEDIGVGSVLGQENDVPDDEAEPEKEIPKAKKFDSLPDIDDIDLDASPNVSPDYAGFENLENIEMGASLDEAPEIQINEADTGEDLSLPSGSSEDIPNINDLNLDAGTKRTDFSGQKEELDMESGMGRSLDDNEPLIPDDEPGVTPPPQEEIFRDPLDEKIGGGDADHFSSNGFGDFGDLGGLSDADESPSSLDAPDFGLDAGTPAEDAFSLEAPAGDDFGMNSGAGDFTLDNPGDLKPPSLSELSPKTTLEAISPKVTPKKPAPPVSEPVFIPEELDELPSFDAPEIPTPAAPVSIVQKPDDISDEELKALRSRLWEFPKELRKRIIGAIIEDKMSYEDTRELVSDIIGGDPASTIEKELNKKVGDYNPELKGEKGSSRTVATRPSYTEAGRRRQAQLMHYTRIGALAALAFIILTTVSYYSLIKPFLYQNIIDDGKEIIMEKGCRGKEREEAEKFFKKSLEYYPEGIDSFLQFGDAYKRKGCYDFAFEKFYGRLEIPGNGQKIRWNEMEIVSGKEIWKNTEIVPIIKWADMEKNLVRVDAIPFRLVEHGAYTITHLKQGKDYARVLLALGDFHTNPVNRFKESDYKNNLLGINYYQRILTFQPQMPLFSGDEYISKAVLGIGNVYYYQRDYYKSLDYFEKIIRNDPYDINGQSGVIHNLIKIYQKTNDPRLLLQQHSLIKHRLKIEEKLPIHTLARLASFYIDLPVSNDLRIQYNVSPVDPVTGTNLRERSLEALNILFSKKEKDIYGNEKDGKTSSEGYYQRGRYYRHVARQPRMALKQMEYAYKYNPAHFLALNERAELLMELYDYEGAMEHLRLAMNTISDDAINALGDQPEDETLLEGDRASIPYNAGKAMYLSLIRDVTSSNAWLRLGELEKYKTKTNSGIQGLAAVMENAEDLFRQAEEIGLKDDQKRNELYYYRGWSRYIRSNFEDALTDWERIDPKWQIQYSNVAIARAHALYHLGIKDEEKRSDYLETALGELIFLQEKLSREIQNIHNPNPGNKTHVGLYAQLSMIENNMGAIYEMMEDEQKSLTHYWKSMEYSKKISRENEIAHLNIQLNFKRKALEDKERYPVIMDYISPHIFERSN